ncbi:PREDICTED: alpha-(1,3)-fucosyltransferase C-like [Priapulus caudatus]|uniref:Fucosyltransferase n=1 Tax=Priapulus caudatus TaxID=37621 RepID=A0ABM1F1H4_PRICU|nr:PREDICTED: alpha-(1,3)-fucosyltransferase C-like [Priapulus caudatus]
METSKRAFNRFTATDGAIASALFVFAVAILEVGMHWSNAGSSRVHIDTPASQPWWKNRHDNHTCRHGNATLRLFATNETASPPEGAAAGPPKLVLLWTQISGQEWFPRYGAAPFAGCRVSNCAATRDHSLIKRADAVVMNFFNVQRHSLPAYYSPRQRWVFYLREPASHTYLKVRSLRGFDGAFNWTMTYRLDSDVPTAYGAFRRRAAAVDYDTDVARRKSKFAAWFATRCPTKSRREEVVAELRQYVDVDTYGRAEGRCNQTRCDDCDWDAMLDDDYRFYLAFENGLCRDYVTEKLYRGLTHDVVPVTLGGVDYARHAPPGSYIDARDFDSVKALADHLLAVAANETLYNAYFDWKRRYVVGEQKPAPWCRLCEKLNDDGEPAKIYEDLTRWWVDDARCETYVGEQDGHMNFAPTFEVFTYSKKGHRTRRRAASLGDRPVRMSEA